MLSKPHRIPSVLISSTLRTGKRVIHGGLQCVVLQKTTLEVWRCAIVVPTSTDKRAVVRNRIKRLISESISHLSHEFPSGIDFVIFVKKGFNYESQEQANTQIYALLRLAGIVTKS